MIKKIKLFRYIWIAGFIFGLVIFTLKERDILSSYNDYSELSQLLQQNTQLQMYFMFSWLLIGYSCSTIYDFIQNQYYQHLLSKLLIGLYLVGITGFCILFFLKQSIDFIFLYTALFMVYAFIMSYINKKLNKHAKT